MGDKFKPRQQRTPKKARNAIVKDMILNTKGGPMRDRRDRRPNDARNMRIDWEDDSYEQDEEVPS